MRSADGLAALRMRDACTHRLLLLLVIDIYLGGARLAAAQPGRHANARRHVHI